MLVDAHHHLIDPAARHYPWMTDELAAIDRRWSVEDFEAEATANSVSASVVVQTVHAEEETVELLSRTARSTTIAGVVGWVDLTASDVAEAISRLRAGEGGDALVGIRHNVHDEVDADWLRRDDVLAGLEVVAAQGLTFDLLIRAREAAAAASAVRALPQLQFVVDHLGKPPIAARALDTAWASGVARLAEAPNVAAKLSGLVTEARWSDWRLADLRPSVKHAVSCFGAERLMFGSDWPVCRLSCTYDAVRHAAQALTLAQDWGAVFGTNAARIYRLSLPPADSTDPSTLNEPTAATPS